MAELALPRIHIANTSPDDVKSARIWIVEQESKIDRRHFVIAVFLRENYARKFCDAQNNGRLHRSEEWECTVNWMDTSDESVERGE